MSILRAQSYYMECQKEKFLLNEGVIYLNGAYMSPLLKAATIAGIDGLLRKTNPQNFTLNDFFEVPQKLKELYAQLLTVENPTSISIVPSVSYGLANIAHNFPDNKKKKIIFVAEAFPSNYYAFEPLIQVGRLIPHFISPPDTTQRRGEKWNELVLQAICNDTAMVVVPQIHWSDGTWFDLKRISSKTKENDALLCIDGTQSFGAMPYDQSIINADVLVAGSYKWLLGPYSVGMAYYGDQWSQGKPIENSWLNRKGSRDFGSLAQYTPEYRSGSQRYDMGEASNFIALPMAIAGVSQLLEWTPQSVQSYCYKISTDAVDRIRHAGYWIEDDDSRAKHLFGIRLPATVDKVAVDALLKKHSVEVSFRGDAIRVSPSVYNTTKDLELLANILEKASV